MLWPLRIAVSKLRPLNAANTARTSIVVAVLAAFLYGDFALFRRLFSATAQIESATPFFALGLLRNLLAMVFLVATVVLFSSALTAAIGAFFSDLDLDLYHAAPQSKLRLAIARWGKSLVQSGAIVFAFLIPLFVAFAGQYHIGAGFYIETCANLLLLLTIPVSLASALIIVLVRWFPVRHVHQIVATIAMIVLTLAVVAFRMSRPERFFAKISTDDVVRVLRTVELPSMQAYPSTSLADLMVDRGSHPDRVILSRRDSGGVERNEGPALIAGFLAPRIAVPALVFFVLFLAIARAFYFAAFVRARETMAPVALGSEFATRLIDRALAPFDVQTRSLVAKEVRTLARDVAQWSQVFLMAALLFIYLYNIRMLPLGGDARATILAYFNVGMAGFVVTAICLRFAYPSVSAEGKSFWMVQSAPVSYRQFLRVKVVVYAAPLTILSLLLTAFANAILHASAAVWVFTLVGSSLLAITLVSLGVGLGAFAPDFSAENPLQVGLSLGGFAYMAVALSYVAVIMLLMARPIIAYFFWRVFGVGSDRSWISIAVPIVIAITLSLGLMVFPLLIAERRLARRL
jgi:ABC-2 type transport system permease protein